MIKSVNDAVEVEQPKILKMVLSTKRRPDNDRTGQDQSVVTTAANKTHT